MRGRRFHPLVFFVVFLTAFISLALKLSGVSRHTPAFPVSNAGYLDVAVSKVYDGDTIKLSNGEKVRFVGIDTPESGENKKLYRDAGRSRRDVKEILRMGHLASDYTHSLLDGRRVRLEFDIEQRDKYGRLLAYVYRVDDGLFINEALVKDGYAYPMTIPPNIRHADEFKRLFRQARHERRGLWAEFIPD